MKSQFTKVSTICGEDQSSSAQIVASIDDLLTQILLRLPIKSLIRFKSVSKHWNSVITDPQFCFMRNPNPNPPVGLFLDDCNIDFDPQFEYVPFSVTNSTNPPFTKSKFFNDPTTKTSVVQSCNGLLLCYQNFDKQYYVCNPTTNQFSTLPKPDGVSRRCLMHLAFDPAKSPHYKVVCAYILKALNDDRGYLYQIEVYSSESRGWRKRGEPFVKKRQLHNGVYWNGAIHWMDSCRSEEHSYFNIDDHTLRVMQMPPRSENVGFESDYLFRESCDHLHHIIESKGLVVVYEMRRDYSEWFVKYRVDLKPVVAAYPQMTKSDHFPPPIDKMHIVSMIRGEKEEDSFLVLCSPGKVIRYNIVCQTFETIYDFGIDEVQGSWMCLGVGFQYNESLVCV